MRAKGARTERLAHKTGAAYMRHSWLLPCALSGHSAGIWMHTMLKDMQGGIWMYTMQKDMQAYGCTQCKKTCRGASTMHKCMRRTST